MPSSGISNITFFHNFWPKNSNIRGIAQKFIGKQVTRIFIAMGENNGTRIQINGGLQ
jgi:hypothetical protein